MPQPGREGGFSSTGLQGSANVPWAVTKDEKTVTFYTTWSDVRIYDGIFQAWDGLGKGFIGGETAIEVFSQSGLPRTDLERIWYAFYTTNLIPGLWRILETKENLTETNLLLRSIWYVLNIDSI